MTSNATFASSVLRLAVSKAQAARATTTATANATTGTTSRRRWSRAAALVPALVLAGCGARSGLFVAEGDSEPQCPEGKGEGAWTQAFGGPTPSYDEGASIATDEDGSVLLAGVGRLQAAPCDTFESRGEGPGFLAKLDARGNLLWEWRTAVNHFWESRVASDGEGGVLFVIGVEGGEDLGLGPLRGGRYVGRANARGIPVFLRRIDSGGADVGGMDVSAEHGFVVASSCALRFEEDAFRPAGAGLDLAEACDGLPPSSSVVQRFNRDGELSWTDTLSLPSAGFVDISGAAFSAGGGVVIAGDVPATLTYGDGTTDIFPELGSPWDASALFVARYDEHGALGAHRLIAGVPAPGQGAYVILANVTVDPASDAVFLGASLVGAPGSFDLGGGPVDHVGAQIDSTNVLAKLGPALEHVWSFAIGGDGTAVMVRVQGDGDGGILALTDDGGTFHAGAFTTNDPILDYSGHVVLVDGAGMVTGVRRFDATVNGVAFGPDGDQLITGAFYRKADFGSGPQLPDQVDTYKGYVASGPLW